jgi:hypothetical protein
LNIKGLCIIYINRSYKCTFAYQKNKDVLARLVQLEKEILSKYHEEGSNKKPVYNIGRQLAEYPGTITLSHVKRGLYKGVVVKIIGIWENETEYGLIHYFYPTNKEPFTPIDYKPAAAPLIQEWVHPCRIFRYPSTCVNS